MKIVDKLIGDQYNKDWHNLASSYQQMIGKVHVILFHHPVVNQIHRSQQQQKTSQLVHISFQHKLSLQTVRPKKINIVISNFLAIMLLQFA